MLGRDAALAAMLLLVVLLTPAPVWAHAFLVDHQPAQGARLEHAPREVALQFSEPVEPASAVLDARRPDGATAELGAVELGSGGRVVRAPLPDRGDGVYVVSWQVTSAVDGHETRGSSRSRSARWTTPRSCRWRMTPRG